MKKIFGVFLFAGLLAAEANAQVKITGSQPEAIRAEIILTYARPTQDAQIKGSGATVHAVVCSPPSSGSFTLTVYGSLTGATGTFSSKGTTTDCSAAISFTGPYNVLRFTMSGMSAGIADLSVTYSGNTAVADSSGGGGGGICPNGSSGAVQVTDGTDCASTALTFASDTLTVGDGGIVVPGSMSGTATIVAPAAAGTPTLTLPTATGTIATNTSILAAVATKSLAMTGATSGAVTLATAATAGTHSIAVPSLDGTMAVTTGTLTDGRCVQIDSSARLVQAAAACGSGSGSVDPSTNGFRLSLCETVAVSNPVSAAPDSTDAGADTVDFLTLPSGWCGIGDIVTPVVTEGGLTAGTTYYTNCSGAVCSFHTTVVDAESGASKVALSADIHVILNEGVERTQICIVPFRSTSIALYNGASWDLVTSAAVCEPLGTLSATAMYELDVVNNMGVPELSFTAWTDVHTPASRGTQDGVLVEAGDHEKRISGSFYTKTTTTIRDSGGCMVGSIGALRGIANIDTQNRVQMPVCVFDDAADYTCITCVARPANNNAANRVDVVSAGNDSSVTLSLKINSYGGTGGGTLQAGFGIDSTTVFESNSFIYISPAVIVGAIYDSNSTGTNAFQMKPGLTAITWVEKGFTATVDVLGTVSGIRGFVIQ